MENHNQNQSLAVNSTEISTDQAGVPPRYPIDSEVYTTFYRNVVAEPVRGDAARIKPCDVELFEANGYGNWYYGPGIPFERKADIAPFPQGRVTNVARLANFFTISDIHISDKESPDQVMFMGCSDNPLDKTPANCSAYSPVMLYTTQVLDAAIQTINALHRRTPFDFGVSLGDTCNNTQYNETRWYINCLNGGPIDPSSGNNPGKGNIPYQQSFTAAGLDKSINWYQTIGNHDHFWIGTFPVTGVPFGPKGEGVDMTASFTGVEIIKGYDVVTHDPTPNYVGAIDGGTVFGKVVGLGPCSEISTPPTVPSGPDGNRRTLAPADWMNAFGKVDVAGSNPIGHGFSNEPTRGSGTARACYSFEIPLKQAENAPAPATAGVSVKVIVLDDTQTDTDNTYAQRGFGHGSLDENRFGWLCKELKEGDDNDKLMIIAAHIPINVAPSTSQPDPSPMGWWDGTDDIKQKDKFVPQDVVLNELHQHPNLLLWLAGHRHFNTVTPQPAKDASGAVIPENSFWEVETASLRDFPQQFRTFEIVLNADRTVSIISTCVDPSVAKGSLADISRTYSIAAYELFELAQTKGDYGSHNVELVKQLSDRMQQALQGYGTPIGAISSLAVDAMPLCPEFDPDRLHYHGTTTTTAPSVRVTATKWYSDETSTLKVYTGADNGWVFMESGHPSCPVPLVLGDNEIQVEVANDSDIRIYSLFITREEGSVEQLCGLALNEGTFAPAFDSACTDYRVNVANSVAQLEVTPTVANVGHGKGNFHPYLQMSLNGGAAQNVTSGKPFTVAIQPGRNTILVDVVNVMPLLPEGNADAPDIKTTRYTITVNRALGPITQPASGNQSTGISLHATVDRNVSCVAFDYGETASYGSATDWQEVGGRVPVGNDPTIPVSFGITGLQAGKTYHCRVKTKIAGCIDFGNDQPFVAAANLS